MTVNTGRLSGLKYKLVCCFRLVVDIVKGGPRLFKYDMHCRNGS